MTHRTETVRDDKFLDYIRDRPCVVCGAPSPNDPHHLDSGVMGSKGDDWACVPLCRVHHRQYHDNGEQWIEDAYDLNFWKCSHRLLRRYLKRRE